MEAPPRPRITVRSTAGFDEAQRILDKVAGQRALALASRKTDKVHKYLAQNYPESTLGWVDGADWSGPQDVPLDDITMGRRPGGRDTEKTKGIAKAITENPDKPEDGFGGPMGAVILVMVPSGALKVADGFHRTAAHKLLGHDTVPAFVGKVDSEDGPWADSFSEMHDAKLNRAMDASEWIDFPDNISLRVGWYGGGGMSQPELPQTVDVKDVLEKQHPYVIEDEDPYNGIPAHHIESIGNALALANEG